MSDNKPAIEAAREHPEMCLTAHCDKPFGHVDPHTLYEPTNLCGIGCMGCPECDGERRYREGYRKGYQAASEHAAKELRAI